MVEQKAARQHDELIRELLDSRIPKSEREHTAAREIERLRAEVERLRGLVVSRFDQVSPPTFRQGIPEHELEDPVTAEQCAWFVAEIERLRSPAASAEPVLWYRTLFGAETKPDGRCYDVVFCDPHDSRYTPLYAAHAIAAKDAEIDALRTRLEDTVRDSTNKIEALRAEVAEWKRVAAAQAELHDEAEARANKLDKILRAYQKAVNRIDDLIEYALPMPRETKAALYSVLANLTEELVKESKGNGQKEAQEL